VVANWPESRRAHWKSLLKARAIENQSYIFGVNRVGSGNGIKYSGDSYLFDPLGESIAVAPTNTPTVLMGEVEKRVVTEVRKKFPFIEDR
jgi:predicted amidohydrolase